MDSIDLNQIIIAVVLSVISSSATFIMGGIWYITRTLQRHKKALDAAFNKIRSLERELNASSDWEAPRQLAVEALDGEGGCDDGSPTHGSGVKIYD